MVLSIAKQRKARYVITLKEYLNEFKNILIIEVDNIGSNQLQQVRMLLRKTGSKMLMGKNTVIRKVLADLVPERPQLADLLNVIGGNMGFVFTNEPDIKAMRDMLTNQKTPAAAKSNQFAPSNVVVPKGITALDPGNTNFFQALDIGTKITRGSIEILSNVNLCRTGERISASAVALLSKLGIKPFFFGIVVPNVSENGSVYSSAVLDMTEDDLANKMMNGIRKVAALSLATGYPTLASVPHSIANAFKKIIAICVETAYDCEESKIYREMLANPDAFKSAGPAASDDKPKEEEVVEEEEEESEEEEMEFDLFD